MGQGVLGPGCTVRDERRGSDFTPSVVLTVNGICAVEEDEGFRGRSEYTSDFHTRLGRRSLDTGRGGRGPFTMDPPHCDGKPQTLTTRVSWSRV